MKYFVIYNILGEIISVFISSSVKDSFIEIFKIMKASFKNGDIILEIEDKCNGIVNGYNNVLECKKIFNNLANGENPKKDNTVLNLEKEKCND